MNLFSYTHANNETIRKRGITSMVKRLRLIINQSRQSKSIQQISNYMRGAIYATIPQVLNMICCKIAYHILALQKIKLFVVCQYTCISRKMIDKEASIILIELEKQL